MTIAEIEKFVIDRASAAIVDATDLIDPLDAFDLLLEVDQATALQTSPNGAFAALPRFERAQFLLNRAEQALDETRRRVAPHILFSLAPGSTMGDAFDLFDEVAGSMTRPFWRDLAIAAKLDGVKFPDGLAYSAEELLAA